MPWAIRPLIEYAEKTFGKDHPKTKFFREGQKDLERYIYIRNALEHPGGYRGFFKISNFFLCKDEKVEEPCCWREKDEKEEDKVSIRALFEIGIYNLMALVEGMFISWADGNLKFPSLTRIICIPKDQRDENCPVKYEVR